jgi:hypothetical protein
VADKQVVDVFRHPDEPGWIARELSGPWFRLYPKGEHAFFGVLGYRFVSEPTIAEIKRGGWVRHCPSEGEVDLALRIMKQVRLLEQAGVSPAPPAGQGVRPPGRPVPK